MIILNENKVKKKLIEKFTKILEEKDKQKRIVFVHEVEKFCWNNTNKNFSSKLVNILGFGMTLHHYGESGSEDKLITLARFLTGF